MPPRARRPRGHIEPLPSGSFRAVVFTGIDPLTRRRQYVRETCSSRAEAEKALTRLQGQVDENRHPKSSITVATAVEQWMEVADLEVTTRERYEDLIRLYIVPTFGDLQAGRLDAELLERFYARLHRCKSWCNPQQQSLGSPPTTATSRLGLAALLWIKDPGESDGRWVARRRTCLTPTGPQSHHEHDLAIGDPAGGGKAARPAPVIDQR